MIIKKGEIMLEYKQNNVVESFINAVSSEVNLKESEKNNETVISQIEQNFAIYESWGREQQGCLEKLAFISAILRDASLEKIIVTQDFNSSLISNKKEKFTCSIIAEDYKLSSGTLKKYVLEKYENLRLKYIADKNGLEKKNLFRINKLNQQKTEIFSFLDKINKKLNGKNDMTIALASYLIYEMESMSEFRIENLLMFYDLYDLNNSENKWFAAINIEAKYLEIKPTVTITDFNQ